jgi:hypothetical protein
MEWSIGVWKGAAERVSFKDAKVFNHFFQANWELTCASQNFP